MIILLIGNYEIAEFLYPDDIKMWWKTKLNIYSIIIALGFYLATFTKNKEQKLFANIGCGVVINTIIDRMFFTASYYELNDFIILAFITLIALYDYKR